MNDPLISKIQFAMEGTCMFLSDAIEQYDLDMSPEDLEDALLDPPHPIERCVVCGWWHEVCMLEFDEEQNGGVCQDCV
jgi:hypothetical protein